MHELFISFETEQRQSEIDPAEEQAVIEPLFGRLVRCLQQRGTNVLTPPSEWDAYGWYIDVGVREAKLTCMMQRSDGWLLIVSSNRTLFDRLKGRRYQAELQWFAQSVSDAVHEVFGVPRPAVQTKTEFRAG